MQRGLGGFPHERLHQDNDFNVYEKFRSKKVSISKKKSKGTVGHTET
ncbi:MULTISPECIES: hypothetical protein [unclassified Moorena]|nr:MULTISPECIES: hypothetical protein [unclassified Moorena]NEO14138.1 hypothetical protein [Moorena sp. SIO3E8]NEQ00650.1 hypothetical protein [Moorena sp. SIO3F7]